MASSRPERDPQDAITSALEAPLQNGKMMEYSWEVFPLVLHVNYTYRLVAGPPGEESDSREVTGPPDDDHDSRGEKEKKKRNFQDFLLDAGSNNELEVAGPPEEDHDSRGEKEKKKFQNFLLDAGSNNELEELQRKPSKPTEQHDIAAFW